MFCDFTLYKKQWKRTASGLKKTVNKNPCVSK